MSMSGSVEYKTKKPKDKAFGGFRIGSDGLSISVQGGWALPKAARQTRTRQERMKGKEQDTAVYTFTIGYQRFHLKRKGLSLYHIPQPSIFPLP